MKDRNYIFFFCPDGRKGSPRSEERRHFPLHAVGWSLQPEFVLTWGFTTHTTPAATVRSRGATPRTGPRQPQVYYTPDDVSSDNLVQPGSVWVTQAGPCTEEYGRPAPN